MEIYNKKKFAIEDIIFNNPPHFYHEKWGGQAIFYYSPQVTFREIPNEISLTIPTLCWNHCSIDCNSKFCWIENNGERKYLDEEVLKDLIEKNKGISCVTIMTSLNFIRLNELFEYIKDNYPKLKTALYIGENWVTLLKYLDFYQFGFSNLDYIKIGGYVDKLGGLESKITNQQFYEIIHQDVGTVFERNIFICRNELFKKGIE